MPPVDEQAPANSPPPETPAVSGVSDLLESPSLVGKTPEAPPVAAGTEPAPAGDVAPFKFDDIKLPEGYTLTDADKTKFGELASEMKLGTEAAQKLVDFHAETMKASTDSVYSAWTDLHRKWIAEVKADPVLANSEGLRPEVESSISKLIDQFGGNDLREAFDLTGAGNNPAVVRFLAKVSQAFTEGTHLSGNPATGPKNVGEIFYPAAS